MLKHGVFDPWLQIAPCHRPPVLGKPNSWALVGLDFIHFHPLPVHRLVGSASAQQESVSKVHANGELGRLGHDCLKGGQSQQLTSCAYNLNFFKSRILARTLGMGHFPGNLGRLRGDFDGLNPKAP